jgi:hypothetical protein
MPYFALFYEAGDDFIARRRGTRPPIRISHGDSEKNLKSEKRLPT